MKSLLFTLAIFNFLTMTSQKSVHEFDIKTIDGKTLPLSTFKGKKITDDQIDKLLLAKEQITWLNVSNCKLNDSHLKIISNLNNLTRFNAHSNTLTDTGIKELKSLGLNVNMDVVEQ